MHISGLHYSKLKSFIFLLMPTLVLVLLGEISLRLMPIADPWANRTDAEWETIYSHFLEPHIRRQNSTLYRFDRELIYTVRPDLSVRVRNYLAHEHWFVSTDHDGYRTVTGANASAPFQVLVMGDSITFGLLVSDQETFLSKAQKILNQKLGAGQITLRNGGIPGFDSEQGKYYLYRVLKSSRPNVVVLAYGMNDSWGKTEPRRKVLERFWKISWLIQILDHSEIYRTLQRLYLQRVNHGQAGSQQQVSLVDFRENLLQMISEVQGMGAKVVLMDNLINGPLPYSKGLADLSAEKKFPLICARQEIARGLSEDEELKNKSVMWESIHPNTLGHSFVASGLARVLLSIYLAQDHELSSSGRDQ
jgi:lysophospholipase L1-like esterase